MAFKKKENTPIQEPVQVQEIMSSIPMESLGTPDQANNKHIIRYKSVSEKIRGKQTYSAAFSRKQPGRLAVELDIEFDPLLKDLLQDDYGNRDKRKKFIEDLHKRLFVAPAEGGMFDISDPYQKLDYLVAKNTTLFSSTATGSKEPGVYYIFFDEEKTIDEKLSKAEKKVTAYSVLEKMNSVDQRNVLRMYGLPVKYSSDKLIKSQLIDKVELNADDFLSKANNKHRKELQLFYTLLEENIVVKNVNVYKYGEFILGSTIDEVISFLNSPTNMLVVEDLKFQVKW